MKSLLTSLYDIEATSFIKISDKVYRIKTKEDDYILKYIDNTNINMIIEKLKILNIDSFLLPVLNNKGEYISITNGTRFIIFPYLYEEKLSLDDLKIKFFLNELSILHNKTYYPLKVNESFFKDTYEYIGDIIDKNEEKIEKYMTHITNLDYKSPSQWLFLLNYPIYLDCIDKANKSLEKFKELSYKKSSVRMTFSYTHFDYNHIFLKEKKIIGIENIELASPIYDIFNTISKTNNSNINIEEYYLNYFNSFILEDYEKEWLYSLLYIPKLNIDTNESINISNICESLEYLKSSYEIIETLKNINYD